MFAANSSWELDSVQAATFHGIPAKPESLKAASQQGPVTQLDLRSPTDVSNKAEWFALNSSRTCEHFELGEGNDASSVETTESVSTVDLLPVTAGSSRTVKRRFRRQRCRQRSRLLAQFPKLSPDEVQDW
mmetsp:Transcript_70667/g.140231  ORF Transcript_70667/g.140231 Transcript_70667/m.140231 type:complete len:130 (-) Transcript_70667:181-570(-)